MGESPSERTHTIVLAIDGLRASALGAYGAKALATPAFDRFAAESTLREWAYAESPDPEQIYQSLAKDLRVPAEGSLLLSDEEATPPPEFASRFDERLSVSLDAPPAPADSFADATQTAGWARFAEALAECASTINRDERLFAWLHTRGLYGAWDAPPSCYEALIDEDDPPVEPSAQPAEAWFDSADAAEACEARFAASCRYAGQVAVLDACLGGLLDLVDGLFEGQSTRVVLFGLRGYPLGEHGRIGGIDRRLFSEQQHVPLLVRTADPLERFQRNDGLTTLTGALRCSLCGETPVVPNSILLASGEARAVLTSDRMARASTGGDDATELYVKPDDRWEQNDIASLEEGAASALLAGHADPSAAEDSA